MKISIGMNLQSGPWGGGNQFGRALVDYLAGRGVDVSFDLKSSDLDLILLTDPRPQLKITAYTHEEIGQYLREVNPRTLVVHRVNECDERKATTGVNEVLRSANHIADHTVFVSSWLRDLHLAQGMPAVSNSVILNGSDRNIFNPGGYKRWDGKSMVRIVTHHWSNHWLKGFDIYQRLDGLLSQTAYRDRISFSYIGNIPPKFSFLNARYLEPLYGRELAEAIQQNHIYLTASRNEPGANHPNDGANCGLPLFYIESGSLPEYCSGYGVSYNEDNFEKKLDELLSTYDIWANRMVDYPNTSERMCEDYHQLFVSMLDKRDEFLARRKAQKKINLSKLSRSFLRIFQRRT